jgi:predicted dehydrogenase
LGGWGRNWYRDRLKDSRLVDVVAMVDSDPDAISAVRDQLAYPADRCYRSLADALAAGEADAVLVTASLPGHVPATRDALAAGKHVLMEKPFAPSVEDAKALVREAERANRVLMISQNYRHFPAPRRAAEMVASGELGRLGVVHIDFRRGKVDYDERHRRHFELPHPLLADMAIHHFDMMRMVTGAEPRRIRCHSFNPPWSHFTEDAAAEAVVEMENGVVITYRGSWVSHGPQTPWAGEWQLEFDRGQLRFTSRDDETGNADRLWVRQAGGREKRIKLPPIRAADRSGSLAEFHRAVRTGSTPDTAGAANVGSIGLTYAAIEAASTGEWVAARH